MNMPGMMDPNAQQPQPQMGGSGMTPEMLNALMMGQQNDPRAQQLTRQQAMADTLRRQSQSQPGMVDTGRIKIAPWGQMGANAMAGYQSRQMQPGIDQGMQEVAGRHAQARAGYADALSMALRRQNPNAGQMMLPPDGMEDQ